MLQVQQVVSIVIMFLMLIYYYSPELFVYCIFLGLGFGLGPVTRHVAKNK